MEQQMQSRKGGSRICYSGANAKERGGRRDPSHGGERDRHFCKEEALKRQALTEGWISRPERVSERGAAQLRRN
ncbi:unnamed protein product [Prunus armeniaca]